MAKRRKKQLAGFIKKDPLSMKNLGQTAGRVGLRLGGAIGGMWVNKMLTDVDPAKGKPMMEPKYSSLLLMTAGLLGEVLIEDPYMRSVAEGVTVVGGLRAFAAFMPDQAVMVGLAGLAATDAAPKPLPGDIEADIDKILREAEAQRDAPTDPTRTIPSGVQGFEESEPTHANLEAKMAG
jgi:hypothetical protein